MARRHLAFTGACWLLFAGEAAAATFVVNSFQDATDFAAGDGICATFGSQVCTLRAAIQQANALPGPDTVTLPAGVYLITLPGAGEDAAATGDLDILGDLTISGAAAGVVIIDGNDIDRVFHILPGRTVAITGVTIRNGISNGGVTLDSVAAGVLNQQSVLTVSSSVIADNGGWGITNDNGTLTVTASTIARNLGFSVGLYNGQFGTATVVNSTISDNTRIGMFNDGVATLVVRNSTVTDNSNNNAEIWNSSPSGRVTLQNTILSGPNGGCGGSTAGFVSNGHNLESGNTCNLFIGAGDRVLTQPLLGPLQDNGGSTPTRAPQTGSAAIDGGSPNAPGSGSGACEATDQRGSARPVDGDGNGTAICDIGAVEVGSGAPPPDSVPDAFTFTDQAGVARSAVISSNTITVAGIDTPTPISVTGGEYSVNGGAFTNAAGTVANGNTVRVRHTSSANFATATNTVLTIGGVADTFTTTTLAQDTTPDVFTFTDQTNVVSSTVVTSNSVTVTGINSAAAISVVGGEYSINNGAFTATAATVVAGDTVRVRLTSSAASSTQLTATLTIGGVTGAFRVTTAATTPIVVQGRGGGGAMEWWAALFLASLLVLRRRAAAGQVIAAGLACVGLTSVAQAQEKGLYLAASIGQSEVSADAGELERAVEVATGDAVNSLTLDKTATSWHLRVGYAFGERVAIEGAYYEFGKVTGRIAADALNPTNFTRTVANVFPRDPNGLAVQGRFSWPLGEDFALALRAGAIFWDSEQRAQLVSGGNASFEADDDDRDLIWGLELEWRRWERFGITFGIDGTELDDSVSAVSVGGVWKMGQRR